MSNVMVASFYKSGSVHIAGSLANLLGSHRSYLHSPGEGYAQDPQRLDPVTAAAMFVRMNGVVYLSHILGTRLNTEIIKWLDVPTIVIMRRLYPCLHSLRRYEDDLVASGVKDDRYINRDWSDWTDEQKWAWLAYNTIPWYYRFYVSWAQTSLPHLTVWYEKHFEDQVAGAYKMMEYMGIGGWSLYPMDQVETSFCHKNFNYSANRTVYPMPGFVRDIAVKQAESWGSWGDKIKEDLL